MTDALNNHEGTVNIGGRNITNLRLADHIDGLTGREEELASTAFGHTYQCRKDQTDDQQHQWLQH